MLSNIIGEQHKLETLLAILEGVDDAIIVADKDKNILLWNQAATDILKVGVTEKKDWSRHYGLFQADGVTPCPESDLPLSKAIRGEKTARTVMFIKNEHMDQGVWVSVTGLPLSFGGVVVFRDITEAQKACLGLKKIIASHEETLAVNLPPDPVAPVTTPAPAPTPQTVVVKIEIPNNGTVIKNDVPNPAPATP